MAFGRSERRDTLGAFVARRGRLSVQGPPAQPIRASGQRAAPTGRTHDRNRTARQIPTATPLATQGPSTHERRPPARKTEKQQGSKEQAPRSGTAPPYTSRSPTAASTRSIASVRPSAASTASIGGLCVLPVSAARSGCATCPSFTPFTSA